MDEGSEQKAAIALARSFGLVVERAERIGGYANAIFRLHPLPLVARVAGSGTSGRGDSEWMARELRIAGHLLANGVRATAPSPLLPPGPHRHGGHMISFWQWLAVEPAQPIPCDLAREWTRMHAALATFDGELAPLAPLTESWRLLDRLLASDVLDARDGALVAARMAATRARTDRSHTGARPLHGDPHYGNLLATADGWVWSDFEDACSGPVEWDVASILASSLVLGRGVAAREVLAAFELAIDPDLLDIMVEARTLMGVAWALVAGGRPDTDPRMRRRLDWLAARM